MNLAGQQSFAGAAFAHSSHGARRVGGLRPSPRPCFIAGVRPTTIAPVRVRCSVRGAALDSREEFALLQEPAQFALHFLQDIGFIMVS